MKCFERIVLSHLKSETSGHMDALQFAYQAKRGVEDATVTLMNHVYKHLEPQKVKGTPSPYVRLLFADFSSAFSTVQVDRLSEKLGSMGVNPILIRWINNFITERLQYVHVQGGRSSYISTQTGVPQGSVLAPLLFILYINDLTSHQDYCKLIKFADDVALIGLLNDDETSYRAEIDNFHSWCSVNSLILNTKKTKEMVFDFRKDPAPLTPVTMNNAPIEIVQEYKYLGTIIDSKLTWNANTNARSAKAQRRLHFLRKRRSFKVDKTLQILF